MLTFSFDSSFTEVQWIKKPSEKSLCCEHQHLKVWAHFPKSLQVLKSSRVEKAIPPEEYLSKYDLLSVSEKASKLIFVFCPFTGSFTSGLKIQLIFQSRSVVFCFRLFSWDPVRSVLHVDLWWGRDRHRQAPELTFPPGGVWAPCWMEGPRGDTLPTRLSPQFWAGWQHWMPETGCHTLKCFIYLVCNISVGILSPCILDIKKVLGQVKS